MADIQVHTVLPDALVRLFPDAPRRLDVRAENVNGLIDGLDRMFPGMGACIRDGSPAIRRHINIFVDSERAELGTPLNNDATVYVFTAISGG